MTPRNPETPSWATPWLPSIVALLVSLCFCFLVYPRISGDVHAVLDPDGYGRLGFGLWQNGTLSFFPNTEPTIARGPAYPAFVCILLAATGGWWPGSVQAAQCLLFALTAALVFSIIQQLSTTRAAFWTALAFSLYPIPIWFTSRIWVEILAMFLMTKLCLALILCVTKPSGRVFVLAGLILGVATLCKSTFLPFLVIAPLLLAWMSRGQLAWRRVLLIPAVAALVVSPWTTRNLLVSGHAVPVHVLTGAAMLDGDYIVGEFRSNPFAYAPSCAKAAVEWRRIESSLPANLEGAEREYALDAAILRSRLKVYADRPSILLRKMAANPILFWFLGESPAKSLAIGIMLLPLAGLSVLAGISTLRRARRTVLILPVAIAFLYFIAHTPLNAVARYSIPLLPLMFVSVGTFIAGWFRRKGATSIG